jgi:DNA/RNA-binding domain of Phe-tRNA-synthetase-like protein
MGESGIGKFLIGSYVFHPVKFSRGDMNPLFQVSDKWKSLYPDCRAGVLVMRSVSNPEHHPKLEEQKAELENRLRARFSGLDRKALLAVPELQAYDRYYRRFDKTYHVQLQLESIVFKEKAIPRVAALVEAMFMAEMENLLLTAGHDLDLSHLPLVLDAADGSETYTLMRGEEQKAKAGDMLIRDGEGVVSSILYGPDQRTRIHPRTKGAVFTVYAPSGISDAAVQKHMRDIQRYVMLIAPQAETELIRVFDAREPADG